MISSFDRPSMIKKWPAQTSAARAASERPFLYSENSCGTLARQKQRTNHLTVECLVSVRAQVLTWDDALAGWLPVDEGALCGISLLQQVTCQQSLSPSVVQPAKRSSWSGIGSQAQNTLPAPSTRMSPQWEYHIQGKRISDQTVLLNCTLMPHVTYRNAMPTFHHWRIKESRFGLSFGSAFDASKFHNRLQKALDHLCRQSKSSSGESNLDAPEDLEDDVFAPIDLPESYSSTSTDQPSSVNLLNVEAPRTDGPGNLMKERGNHGSQSLPRRTFQHPIPTIRTTLSTSSISNDAIELCIEENPPMDPESARTSTSYQTEAKNFDSSKNFTDTTGGRHPTTSNLEWTPNAYLNSKRKASCDDEDDLLITDDNISVPATLHHSLLSSLSSNSKVNSTKAFEKPTAPRFRSKSRSDVSSTDCRTPFVIEKMRSASNPGTGLFIPKGNYPHLERHISSPKTVGKARSFLEARSSLYKNQDHVLLPKKKQPSSEMMRRECCFYCRSWYNVRDNPRGSCKEAPDPIEKVISYLTCYPVAQGAIYHCCKENDEMPVSIGRYGQGYNICSCGPPTMSKTKRMRRWLLLALLSLFVPCLCCYLPVRAMYKCTCKGRRGRHKPCTSHNETDFLMRSRVSRRMSRLSF